MSRLHVGYIVVNEIEQCIWWKFIHPGIILHLEEDPMLPEDHFDIPNDVLTRPGFYLVITDSFTTNDCGDIEWGKMTFEKGFPTPNELCVKCDGKMVCFQCYPDHACRFCGGDLMITPPVLVPFVGGEQDAPICESCYADIGVSYLDQLNKPEASTTFRAETSPLDSNMEFVLCPAGEFMMGDGPSHPAEIRDPFLIGKYLVTQEEWEAVMNTNPSRFKGELLPVENISWDDCQEFILRLNEWEGEDLYRLPSDVEWEYACRAGTTTRFSFGDDEGQLELYGWFNENAEHQTHPVGEKFPNKWGIHDMHGNVWEWCQDRWPHGVYRVVRGGGWFDVAGVCTSASRFRGEPSRCDAASGVRLVKKDMEAS